MACAIRCRDPADVEPRNGTMEERDPEWTGCAKSPEISRDSHPGNRYRVDGHHARSLGHHRQALVDDRDTPSRRRPPCIDFHQRGGRSEEHTSDLQSLMRISYAVVCLIKNTLTKIYLHTLYVT